MRGRRRRLAGLLVVAGLVAPVSAHAAATNGRIAFFGRTSAPGNYGDTSLYTANPDGSAVHRLPIAADGRPAWSPDGTKLAYPSGDGLNVADADGANAQALVAGTRYYSGASWSPDGTRIAFSGRAGDGTTAIFTVAADGSDLQQLTASSVDIVPMWSPTGKIAYAHQDTDASSREIWVMDADGAGAHAIAGELGSANEVPAGWSPDGSKLLISHALYGAQQLETANADGTARHSVAPAVDGSWSPDGTQIVLESGTDQTNGLPALETVAATGGTPVKINLRGYFPSWGTAPLSTTDEPAYGVRPACSDGFDNDGDGRADYPGDPGCTSPVDDSELKPACMDRRDNDGDGKVDYPDDPACSSPNDTSEVKRAGAFACTATALIAASRTVADANPGVHGCVADSISQGLPSFGGLTIGGAGAQTAQSPVTTTGVLPQLSDHATARANVAQITLMVGTLPITLTGVTATAEVSCAGGVSQHTSNPGLRTRTSSVGSVKIGGLSLGGFSTPVSIPVGAGYLRLNSDYAYDASGRGPQSQPVYTVRRAVTLDLPGDTNDVVIAQAGADSIGGAACTTP